MENFEYVGKERYQDRNGFSDMDKANCLYFHLYRVSFNIGFGIDFHTPKTIKIFNSPEYPPLLDIDLLRDLVVTQFVDIVIIISSHMGRVYFADILFCRQVHFACKICAYLEGVGMGEGEHTLDVTLTHTLKHRICESLRSPREIKFIFVYFYTMYLENIIISLVSLVLLVSLLYLLYLLPESA